MLRLLNSSVGPVGGFRFIDPDNGFSYDRGYRTFEELASHIEEHRKQNKLPPIESLREVWENWICQEFGMEKNCCAVSADISRTFDQYVSGAKALVRRALSSDPFVSPGEAEVRSSICVDCNQNLANIGHRMSQMYSDNWMVHQIGNRATSQDSKLFTCKVCTCLLRAKVHYPDAEVAASLSDTDIGRLHREPKSLRTGQHLDCWQLHSLNATKGK